MAERTRSMLQPPIEELLEKAGSKFILVSLAAKRARQINEYRSRLGDGLGTLIPPQLESDASKSLSLAFDEIAADRIIPIYPEPVVDEVDSLDIPE
ncbi:MAG: DNA-directed RNA polymerase subunit omega [Ferrimicrobium sp.]